MHKKNIPNFPKWFGLAAKKCLDENHQSCLACNIKNKCFHSMDNTDKS